MSIDSPVKKLSYTKESLGLQRSEDFSEAVRGVFEDIKAAVSYFDYIKPSSSYVPKPVLEAYRARSTGRENLIIFKFYIPHSRVVMPPAAIIVAAYRSLQSPVKKYRFEKAADYIGRRIGEFIDGDRGFERHYFIYFCGFGFRAGVEEAKRDLNSKFIGADLNARITLVDMRSRSVGLTVREDLFNYLYDRVHSLIEKLIAEGKSRVRGSLKNFIDYVILVAARLTDRELYEEAKSFLKERETPLDRYRALIEKLGPLKRGSEAAGRKYMPRSVEEYLNLPVADT